MDIASGPEYTRFLTPVIQIHKDMRCMWTETRSMSISYAPLLFILGRLWQGGPVLFLCALALPVGD
ncbi:hypothetical protein D3C81_2050100 [compost metagenome]